MANIINSLCKIIDEDWEDKKKQEKNKLKAKKTKEIKKLNKEKEQKRFEFVLTEIEKNVGIKVTLSEEEKGLGNIKGALYQADYWNDMNCALASIALCVALVALIVAVLSVNNCSCLFTTIICIVVLFFCVLLFVYIFCSRRTSAKWYGYVKEAIWYCEEKMQHSCKVDITVGDVNKDNTNE